MWTKNYRTTTSSGGIFKKLLMLSGGMDKNGQKSLLKDVFLAAA
jgi:hypothetical protein